MVTATETKSKMLTGLFIDPFKGELSAVEIAHDSSVWRQVLKCSCIDCVCIAEVDPLLAIDIWIDDEGLLRNEPRPFFKVKKGRSFGFQEVKLCGYGLVLGCDPTTGKTVSLDVPTDKFGPTVGLAFERWHHRLDANEHMDELLRTIELELPGKFRLR